MSVSYIYEGNYAVCTFQMTPAPQKLVASRINPRPISDSEVLHLNEKGEIITTPLPPYNINVTTFHQDDKILLNIRDKNAEVTFGCKLPTQLATTFLAFGAGLLGGLASVVVAALLVGTPIGWIAIGIGAIIAVACIGAGLYHTVKAVNHICTGPMQSGMWMLPHSSVEFDGYPAITQAAMLSCGNGGIVKPFLTLALAQKAGESISDKNYWEVGINGVISFFAGYFTGTGFFAAFAVESAAVSILGRFVVSAKVWETSTLVGGTIIGTPLMMYLLGEQSSYMRGNDDLSDNESYQNMNFAEASLTSSTVIDDPSDLSNPFDLNHFYQMLYDSKDMSYIKDPVLQSQLDQLKGLSRPQLSRSPLAKDLITKMNNGELPQLREAMKNYSDKFRPNMLGDAQESNKGTRRERTRINMAKNKFSTAKKFSAGMLYFFPFINTALSENVRRDIAEAAEMDIEAATGDKGSTVLADRPLG